MGSFHSHSAAAPSTVKRKERADGGRGQPRAAGGAGVACPRAALSPRGGSVVTGALGPTPASASVFRIVTTALWGLSPLGALALQCAWRAVEGEWGA